MKLVVRGLERAERRRRPIPPALLADRTKIVREMKAWRLQHAATPGSASKARPQLRGLQRTVRGTQHQLESSAELVDELRDRVEVLEEENESLGTEVEELRDALAQSNAEKDAANLRAQQLFDELSVSRRFPSIPPLITSPAPY